MSQRTAYWSVAESFGCARDWCHFVLIIAALVPVSIAIEVMLSNGASMNFKAGMPTARFPLSNSVPVSPLKTREPGFLTAFKHTRWRAVRVHAGASLPSLLADAGVAAVTSKRILKLPDAAAKLEHLRKNRFLELRQDRSGRLLELQYDLNAEQYLDIVREGRHFEAQIVSRPNAEQRHFVSAHINGSLYQAGQHAGISAALMTKLVHLFQGHIDFRRETRRGDSFKILYAGRGKDARILAADLAVHGKHHQVFRFPTTAAHGRYYTEAGRPLSSGIERAPIDYTRISSRFSYHRMNPVLHVVRPHYGVDYAAPTGTPVKAAADGKVIFRGRGGGYGRLIVMRSYKHYKIYYAHMHRFAKGIAAGDWVRQGKVIGYVGESGIATGPHLHFGIRVSGVWKNPLTVKLPKSHPLAHAEIAKFRRHISPFVAALDDAPAATAASSTLVAESGKDKKSSSAGSTARAVLQVR